MSIGKSYDLGSCKRSPEPKPGATVDFDALTMLPQTGERNTLAPFIC